MRHLPSGSGIAWEGLLAVPFASAVLWIRLRGVGWAQMADALGWRKGEGIFREALAGMTVYIAGVPVLAAATAVTALLSELAGTTATHPIVQGVHASVAVKAFLFFLACIFAPITEETLFRGMLLGHLRFRHSWVLSAIVVSVIFAAIHPQGWTAIPVLATVAMILSVLREQRKSLIGPMTAHAMNNTLILVMLFLVAG
jgi:membrane protease YdiL (CAAX protease family)